MDMVGDTIRGVGLMGRIYIKCIRRWAGEGGGRQSATTRMCIGNFSWVLPPSSSSPYWACVVPRLSLRKVRREV